MDVCRRIESELRTRPEFGHTSHFLVMVDGSVVFDAHYQGPLVADVFSITKSVVATLAGIAVRDGLLRDLDAPVESLLGTPSQGQTPRHLLTMRRGSQNHGPYDIDEVMALPSGWLARMADAPQLDPPGAVFRYDDAAAHLFGAELSRLVGMPLSDYAARELFAPLGIADWGWPRDPEGFDHGFANLRLAAADLAKLGALWMDHGQWEGRRLMDPGFARDMLSPQTEGSWPENRPYGYLIWIDEHGPFAGGWAGQHVTLVPAARTVIVTTGDPRLDPEPPFHHLPHDWRPARELVVEHLIPALLKP